MDEQSWLNSQDPAAMLKWLQDSGKLSERKARLFAVACCRRIWGLLDDRCRTAAEAAELFADGLLTSGQLRAAVKGIPRISGQMTVLGTAVYCATIHRTPFERLLVSVGLDPDVWATDRRFASSSAEFISEKMGSEEREAQASHLRDIFGLFPFRPVLIDRSCLSPAIVALAEAAYDERKLPKGTLDPALLAALADALEEAGCADPDVIRHLRWEEGHVRGCWLVDLLLQKG